MGVDSIAAGPGLLAHKGGIPVSLGDCPAARQEKGFDSWQKVELQMRDQAAALTTSHWSVPDSPAKSAAWSVGMTAETVSRLCHQGLEMESVVEALGLLVEKDCPTSQSLFYTVLKKCVAHRDLVLGRRVHALAVKVGCESDTFLCNHIMRLYTGHGRLQDAMDVFHMVATPDAFSWSAIISAHVKEGQDKQAIQLYHRMRRSGVKPDGHVFVAALQACARGRDLDTGQQVHADVLASGLETSLFVSSCLVDMYAKCGSLEDAQRVFHALPRKDVVTWNAMIAGYSQQGKGKESLRLHEAMQEEGIVALDAVTITCLLQACASVGTAALEKGRQLHARIREQGRPLADVFVASSLVNMYAKCGSLEEARDVFDELRQKNVVTWSAMIAGYSQHGMGLEALRLYKAMQEDGMIVPNAVTFVCLLQSCATVGTPALETGKEIHAQITEQGLQADVFPGGALVNMYAKCGSIQDARAVFDGLPHKDVVTWTALIAGYSQQGMSLEALNLYKAMGGEGMVPPDAVTFGCLLQACASVAALHLGRQLHAQIKDAGLQLDGAIGNSLVNMYAKSGSMAEAQHVFDAMPERDVVTWSALIAGYTRQGASEVVFDLYHRMIQAGIQPAAITLLSVLTVCSHAGLVHKGQEYFESMTGQYGITPTVEHYACMVDLLGRAGRLDESLALVCAMPVQPNAAVWHALLGACQKWNNVELGCRAFDEAIKLDKKDAAAYVLMSNIYTGAQMWKQAQEMQVRRTGIQAWKQPGQSWWTDTDGVVHSFLVRDQKHPESGDIYIKLQQLLSSMNKAGSYVPHLDPFEEFPEDWGCRS